MATNDSTRNTLTVQSIDSQNCKECAYCKRTKLISQFPLTKTGKVFAWCYDCRIEQGRQSGGLARQPEKLLSVKKNRTQLTGTIYFVLSKELNRIKIGHTQRRDIDKRIKAIQGQSPSILVLMAIMSGSVADELILHKRFAAYHSHNEWFEASDEILDFIRLNAMSYL